MLDKIEEKTKDYDGGVKESVKKAKEKTKERGEKNNIREKEFRKENKENPELESNILKQNNIGQNKLKNFSR